MDALLRSEFNETQINLLNQKGEEEVQIHPYQGTKYFASHELIRRANEVFGQGNWETSIVGLTKDFWDNPKNGVKQITVTAHTRLTVYTVGAQQGMTFEDVGTATGQFQENAFEMAIKGAVSDAEKRCLRHFGDYFGLWLYDKDVETPVVDATEPKTVKAPYTPRPSANAPTPSVGGLNASSDPDTNKYRCSVEGCDKFQTGFQPKNGNYVPVKRMLEKSQALDGNAGNAYCSDHYRAKVAKG